VYELALPIMPRDALAACMSDPITEAHLRSDIAWAAEHDIKGTPLVLLNGREVAPFGPLLYALILSGGEANHPAFASLPEPKFESSGHTGHDHGSDGNHER
jgi:serine/threonine-protein kinase